MIWQALDPTPAPAPPDANGSAAPLLPPRPNLGPEPWREPGGVGPWVVAAVVVVALLGWAALRARARRRRRRPAAARPPTTRGPAGGPDSQSPADRLVSRAEAIRSALIAAFGPAWAARTTEEIAVAPELAERIGPERASQVVALLAEADRAKFAGGEGGEPQGIDEADTWIAEVLDALVADGATSTSSGR